MNGAEEAKTKEAQLASCELWSHHWQGKQVTGRAEWTGTDERRPFRWVLIHGLLSLPTWDQDKLHKE